MTKQGTWIAIDDWELRDDTGYVIAGATLGDDKIYVGAQYTSQELTIDQLNEYIEALTLLRDRMEEQS